MITEFMNMMNSVWGKTMLEQVQQKMSGDAGDETPPVETEEETKGSSDVEVTPPTDNNEPEVIELDPTKNYRLAGSSVDPVSGDSLWTERMLHKDYTQKRQQESEQMTTLSELVNNQKAQIEQLNNQMLKLKLGEEFVQEQKGQQVSGQGEQRQTTPVTGVQPQDTGYYDMFSSEPETEPSATTTQQGFNSTPTTLNLNQLVPYLVQHPDFVQAMDKLSSEKAEKLVAEREARLKAEQEVNAMNTQLENNIKQRWGDDAANLMWGMFNSAINEGDVKGAIANWDKFAEIAGKRYHEMQLAKEEEERKAAVEAAIATPAEIEPVEGESESERKDRAYKKKLETVKMILGR